MYFCEQTEALLCSQNEKEDSFPLASNNFEQILDERQFDAELKALLMNGNEEVNLGFFVDDEAKLMAELKANAQEKRRSKSSHH